MVAIQIVSYKNKKTEKLCTDYAYAKKKLDSTTAEKLFALLDFILDASTLKDVASIPKYRVHPLHWDREGELAIDIDGIRSSYRLIVEPATPIDTSLSGADLLSRCNAIKAISITEVSKHYE